MASAHSERITEKFVRGAPDLIVEIISPTTEIRDRGIKLHAYARFGVPEYWIWDAFTRSVDVHVLRGKAFRLKGRYGETDVLRSQVLPDLEIPLAGIWPKPLPRK